MTSDLDALFKQAIGALQAGRLDDAERHFKAVLTRQPRNAAVHDILGALLTSGHRYGEAEEHLRSALSLNPSSNVTLYNHGIALKGLGRPTEALQQLDKATMLKPSMELAWLAKGDVLHELRRHDEALAAYDRTLVLKPDLVEAHLGRGNAFYQSTRYSEALQAYERVLASESKNAEAWLGCGNALIGLERYDDALTAFDKALTLSPDLAGAWVGRGNVLIARKHYDEAMSAHDKALAIKPNLAVAWVGRGNALYKMMHYNDALAAYDKALALAPDLAAAWLGRGNACAELKRPDEALQIYDTTLKLRPDFAEAWLGRGNAFSAMQRYPEALEAYDKALALGPKLAGAWVGRGTTLVELRQHADAVVAFEQGLKLDPDFEYAEGYRLHSKQHICDWSNLNSDWERLLTAMRTGAAKATPFTILGGPASPADHIQSAKTFTKDKHFQTAEHFWQNERYSHDRIRIAYVSPDYREHAVARLLASLFEHHDRTRFEIIAIALGPDDQSNIRTRMKRAFDRFIDVHNQSDRDVARLIRELEVDVVVDLAGFTSGGRPAILSFRPAPIQMTYLSYPGIIGASCIDYILADRFVIPEDHRSLLSERVVYLPDAYLGYDTTQSISERAPTRAEQGLPEAGFIFCAYNNTFKIMPQVFDIWMRLLKNISGSVLWLMGANATAVSNLRREAQARGVDPDRLYFAPFVKDVSDHLARYRLADLFLDTLPFNAQTTACDALWAGLPVLTCLGSNFVGRAAASLLSAIDMPELITHSAEEYEMLALKLATDAAQLAGIRRKLAGHRLTTPLFDSVLFTRRVEAAYSAMVERHRAGLPPEHIVIPRC